jgi:hypothetical protein
MTSFGLREAAEQAKTSKSSIWRAIKSGRLSATKSDGGDYSIDAAELFRAFPPERAQERHVGHSVTAVPSDETTVFKVRMAALEAEIGGLKMVLAERDRLVSELQGSREDWKGRAERLLAGPEQRPWWRRLAG